MDAVTQIQAYLIVATMKHLAPERSLVLAGLTGPVDRVFRLTRMDSVFSLYPTLDHALQDLASV